MLQFAGLFISSISSDTCFGFFSLLMSTIRAIGNRVRPRCTPTANSAWKEAAAATLVNLDDIWLAPDPRGNRVL